MVAVLTSPDVRGPNGAMSTLNHDVWRARLRGLDLPAAVVDLDAFDFNTDLVARTLGTVAIRPATKSIRAPFLIARLAARLGARVSGWMLYSAREAELLASHPDTRHLDDFLIAYPVATPRDAERLFQLASSGRTIRAIVDHPDHLALFSAAGTPPPGFSLVLDIDAAWRPLTGLIPAATGPHLGVRRSCLRSPEATVTLARTAAAARLQVSGLMAYEAQVAGIRPHNPGSRHLDPIRRWIRKHSVPDIAARRALIVDALRAAGFPPLIVNGGGTGSLASTTIDASVTEVTAGSAFLAPHLFDGHAGLPLEPAAFFALPIARFPDAHHVTCAFGGFIASGPPASDRAPIVYLPPGLEPLGPEGFGEVQTPLRRTHEAPSTLKLGDPVLCRHAKSGEMFEHFNVFHAFSKTSENTTHPTYRGLGLGPG